MLHAALASLGCFGCTNQLRNVTNEWQTLASCFVNNREVRVTGNEGLDFDEIGAGLPQINHRAPCGVRVIRSEELN